VSTGAEFYQNMVSLADRLITKYGQATTVNRYSPTSTLSTGGVTKGSPTATFTTVVAQLPESKALDNSLEDASLTKCEKRYLIIPAKDATFIPHAMDEIVFDGSTWQLKGCTPSPGGTPVIYGMGVVKL
jgi:hypothetical protein